MVDDFAPKAVEKMKKANQRNMDPQFKRDLLEIFNDVWYDFDEEKGQVRIGKYKKIMKFVQNYKRIPNKPGGPFSDERLEQAFNDEDAVGYTQADKVDGQIPHRSVMYILHDIFEESKLDKASKI